MIYQATKLLVEAVQADDIPHPLALYVVAEATKHATGEQAEALDSLLLELYERATLKVEVQAIRLCLDTVAAERD